MKSVKVAVVLAAVALALSGCASISSAWTSVSDEVSGWFSSSDSKDAKK